MKNTAKPLPSQKYIRECLKYNPKTGKLFWKKRPLSHFKNESGYNRWNARWPGKPAFTARMGKAGFIGHIGSII